MRKWMIVCVVLMMAASGHAATRNVVPNADGEGSLGTDAKRWGSVNPAAFTLTNNVSVTGIQTNGNLVSDSQAKLVTEFAIKKYVDDNVSAFIPAYGELFASSSIGLAIPTATNYFQVTNMTVGVESGGTLLTGTTSNITVGSTGAGVYIVLASLSASPDNSIKSEHTRFTFHVNGAAQEKAAGVRVLGNAADEPGSISVSATLSLSASDVIDVRVFVENAAAAMPAVLTFERLNISMHRIN